ncbi:ribonuclease H-like domain-containing protein, partial [Candidatus Poribacteria bacterium]|nr:ribonuclease H-like domain-containing protein [Candidatus Poribacteria bacterium]
DYCHEPRMIRLLEERLSGFDAFCTYNGRAFEVPLLVSRSVMNRRSPAVWSKPNLDLLHPARRLWRGGLPSVSLGSVEQNILGIAREGDVPGAEIPAIWENFARTGQCGRLPHVLRHNAQDIASLVCLLERLARCHATPEAPGVLERPCECLGLARWNERQGDRARACRLLERAAELIEDGDARDALLLDLARLYRRTGRLADAAAIWQSMRPGISGAGLTALIELAKHHEHHTRDFPAAHRLVYQAVRELEIEEDLRELLGRVAPARTAALDELRHRLQRLEKRLAGGRKKGTELGKEEEWSKSKSTKLAPANRQPPPAEGPFIPCPFTFTANLTICAR